MTNTDLLRRLQNLYRAVAQHARNRESEREELRRSPMVPKEGLNNVLRQFDTETNDQRRVMIHGGLALTAHFREFHVLSVAPDNKPKDLAEAMWVAAKAQTATLMSPDVLVAEMDLARKRNDLPALQMYTSVAESKEDYSKAFQIGAITNAIQDAQEHLSNTPELVASREAEQFVEEAESELRLMDALLGGKNPIVELNVYEGTNSFALLSPAPALNPDEAAPIVGTK